MSSAVERWYAGRRTLVIGGFGYLGSTLTRALFPAGAAVTIVTPSRERHAAAARESERAGGRVIEADARDLAAMREAVRDQDVVFSLAGRSGSVRSVDDPAADLDANCGGALALIEALRHENAAAKLVFAGSRLVYGAVNGVPVAEDHALAPLCPHGLHKAAVEQYLQIYGRLHGLRWTALRITNPYGPGQPSDRRAYGVINYLVHRAVAGDTLPIYGDGAQLRDYVFVDDVVDAMLAAGCDERSDRRIFNVGSGVGTSMIDAAHLIIETVGAGRIERHEWPAIARKVETGDFVADVTRIRDELGWRPTIALAVGLRRTVDASAAGTARCR